MLKRAPKEVPVLEARHMFKGYYSNHDGTQRCLLGWCRYVFKTDQGDNRFKYCNDYFKFKDAIIKQINLMQYHTSDIVSFNDCHATKSECALVWNRAMEDLGYDVTNAK